MEHQSLLEKLDFLITDHSHTKNPSTTRILMGYKTYAKLMLCPQFIDEITNSALDPDKRKYKNIKIKVTKDDDQLELE